MQKRFDLLYKKVRVGEYVPDLIAFDSVVVDTKVKLTGQATAFWAHRRALWALILPDPNKPTSDGLIELMLSVDVTRQLISSTLVRLGFADCISPSKPATKGAAIEVPLKIA